MSETITGQVVGAEAVTARFKSASSAATSHVRKEVQQLGLQLQRLIKEKYLTGGALGVRTGRLRRSVNEETTVEGGLVKSAVGTNVVYGAAWERGFDRLVGAGSRGGKVHPHVAAAQMSTKSYAPRPFLQPALEEMRPIVRERLQGVAKDAAKAGL